MSMGLACGRGGRPASEEAALRAPARPPRELAAGSPRNQVTAMRRCLLDGSRLGDAEAVCRTLGEALRLPEGLGGNPEALGEAIAAYAGEPVAVVWRNAARSSRLLGPRFAEIVSALQRAAAQGRLTLELA
jgi:RNAse (barnase) inhibitor barstar